MREKTQRELLDERLDKIVKDATKEVIERVKAFILSWPQRDAEDRKAIHDCEALHKLYTEKRSDPTTPYSPHLELTCKTGDQS